MHSEVLHDTSRGFTKRVASWLASLGLLRSVLLLTAVVTSISLSVRLAIHLVLPEAGRATIIGFASAAVIPMLATLTTGTFVMRLVLDLERMRAALQEIAKTDGLTGALNRLAFMSRAESLMETAADRGHTMALLMIDVDRFKAINDTYGHAGGDKAIQEVAARCQAQLRKHDLFARFGGEEFVVLLPETEEATAYHVAERIRVAVENARIEDSAGTHFSVTVSIGSVHSTECPELGAMLRRADENLYHAKRLGRNRLCIG
ncbi:GGDEF domain-containing protein [Xylophilus sp. GOD-11R]|uniref:GGDEF domain-containing protein n=1 Tax=Xylophilus sp. GOD-11R TaxID=3089814 RepID=UPI00298D1341|nr:GGDEF domain-containing protein [Xylophilus sp. GOD-11R]WPB59110.1 GGDEF domain-containing protein [Xylophilus sp. GOD-11R]